MRTFIGIEIPFEAKRKIFEVEKKIFKGKRIKGVEINNLHITLFFLGEVNENALDEIKNALHTAAKKSKPFMASIGDVDGFPETNHARIVYLSIEKGKLEIKKLFKNIEASLGDKFKGEEREYIPHITIGRVKKGRLNVKGVKFSYPPFSIDHFTLFKSELRKQGPEYTVIQRFKIGDLR